MLPLDIVDEVAAVLAAVQGDGYETGLGRHEAGALGHQLEHLGLVVWGHLDGRDLGHDVAVFAVFGLVRSPACAEDNARAGMKFPACYTLSASRLRASIACAIATIRPPLPPWILSTMPP